MTDLNSERCEVQTLDGTEACPEKPWWILTWPAGITRDMKSATVCQRCGLTWIEQFTDQGKVVTVRPVLSRVFKERPRP